MTKAEMAYPVHEQELLALIKMCNRGAHMLRGKAFTANTDHHALIYLQRQPNLQQYDIKLKYFPGKENTVADFISRNPTVMPKCADCGKAMVQQISINPIQASITQQIKQALRTDEWGQTIIQELTSQDEVERAEEESVMIRQYSYCDELLRWNRKIYLPAGKLRTDTLQRYHNIVFAAHQGAKKTL
jgi:hypothetical protein